MYRLTYDTTQIRNLLALLMKFVFLVANIRKPASQKTLRKKCNFG